MITVRLVTKPRQASSVFGLGLVSDSVLGLDERETERAKLVTVLDAQMLRLEITANALRRPLEDVEAHIRASWSPPVGVQES